MTRARLMFATALAGVALMAAPALARDAADLGAKQRGGAASETDPRDRGARPAGQGDGAASNRDAAAERASGDTFFGTPITPPNPTPPPNNTGARGDRGGQGGPGGGGGGRGPRAGGDTGGGGGMTGGGGGGEGRGGRGPRAGGDTGGGGTTGGGGGRRGGRGGGGGGGGLLGGVDTPAMHDNHGSFDDGDRRGRRADRRGRGEFRDHDEWRGREGRGRRGHRDRRHDNDDVHFNFGVLIAPQPNYDYSPGYTNDYGYAPSAPGYGYSPYDRLTYLDIRQELSLQGFSFIQLIRDADDYYVVDAVAPDGRQVRLTVDAYTGQVISGVPAIASGPYNPGYAAAPPPRPAPRIGGGGYDAILRDLGSLGYRDLSVDEVNGTVVSVRAWDPRGLQVILEVDRNTGRIMRQSFL